MAPSVAKCWMEASVFISGAALVQGGLDYYVSLTSSAPLEAGVSNWSFASPGWQELTWGK
ncbi:MAG: hypothetical protein WA210_17510 [Burkholderiaceae bacterium]